YRIRQEVREQLGVRTDDMENHARTFFKSQPAASAKAANDEIYKVFQARIQNRLVYRIRQEVRQELGLDAEGVRPPRQQRLLTIMEHKPPTTGGKQQQFSETEDPPLNEPIIVPCDEF